jgi:hypothetical protein
MLIRVAIDPLMLKDMSLDSNSSVTPTISEVDFKIRWEVGEEEEEEGGEKEIIDEEIQGLSLQRMRRQMKRQEERLWREVVSFLVLKVFSQFHFFSFLFLLCGKRSWLAGLCCLQEGWMGLLICCFGWGQDLVRARHGRAKRWKPGQFKTKATPLSRYSYLVPGEDVCAHFINGRVCYYCPPPALPQEEDEEQEQEERGGKRGEGKGGVATSEGDQNPCRGGGAH